MFHTRAIRTGSILCSFALALSTAASPVRRTPVVEAVSRVLPSVVNIGTERIVKVVYRDPFYNLRSLAQGGLIPPDFLPPPLIQEQRRHSLGSGVIVDEHGYILTNYHVIEQASAIRIALGDGTVYDARLLAGDPLNDLALLKIQSSQPLPAIAFARDDDLLLGETVIALGNPFGFSQTVTVGVLSGINREARYRDNVVYRDILQTDAAVNYGSSGGPLVNLDGEMIGLNVQILQQAQNIGFAIPVKRVRTLLGEWMSPRVIRHGWLGFEIAATEVPPAISHVEPGSEAHQAGLAAGMRVVSLGGEAVPDAVTFHRKLIRLALGERVRVDIDDGSSVRAVELTMVPVPRRSGDQLARERLGLVLSASTPEQARRAGFTHGLGIEGVLAGGAAAASGMRPGLLLTRINNVEIRESEDVAAALESVRPGEFVKLRLVRLDERTDFILAEVSYWDIQAR
ncbi:MAG: trypsin-like peptidase domain-containing protein [Kiritimatiellae bacterium]|nr:trypsin-like peptidase domain-containing protein [Kiritimatiellia bacterium]MDW8458448.1 trypsin-like peptidase domain-containing protein [Verrucomicrobiota bacterium]